MHNNHLMATPFQCPSLVHKSQFLGQINFTNSTHKYNKSTIPKLKNVITAAKFNLSEILGGRGLCNGEEGLQKELQKTITKEEEKSNSFVEQEEEKAAQVLDVSEDGFEKELLGLTGRFPGGEKGLNKFIEQNPPPKKDDINTTKSKSSSTSLELGLIKKPKPPELPLFLPGMIAIVKNPNNPFYMYCGIVQRITDGKAGVLFEGGNWDKLITFRLEELERREKGPPMVNPRSVILEQMLDNNTT